MGVTEISLRFVEKKGICEILIFTIIQIFNSEESHFVRLSVYTSKWMTCLQNKTSKVNFFITEVSQSGVARMV